ncbi:short chain dehydrogenase domain-containing protein [Ditylenchus destructor]|nr:short chain dehydrogenase domain-containing protein [Ditylenchus destructor]
MINVLVEFVLNVCFIFRSFFTAFCRHILPETCFHKKSLEGKVVLVTGAGSGIGRQLAKCFASDGANLLLWDIVEATNIETAEICRKLGTKVFTQTVDVGNHGAIHRAVDDIEQDTYKAFGPDDVDIVMINAGIISEASFLESTDSHTERVMYVNVFQSFWLVKAFLPRMLKRGSGHIAVTGSAASWFGMPGLVDYSASKAAVCGFMEALEHEVHFTSPDKDIRFTVICPCFVNTPLIRDFTLTQGLPLLSPEEVARKAVNAIRMNHRVVMMPALITFLYALKG